MRLSHAGAVTPRLARRGVLAGLALPWLGLTGCSEAPKPAAPETVLRTERAGPPGWVTSAPGQDPQMWVLTRQTVRDAAGTAPTRQRIDLHAFDTRTAARLWGRRLRVRADAPGQAPLEARLLGQEGEHVWLFVDGQPVRLAARDGAVRALSADIETAVPFLRGRLPSRLDAYAFDQGLVVWVEGAPRWRVHGTTLQASGYMPPSEEHLRTIRWLSQQWPGAFETRLFGVRQLPLPPGQRQPAVALYADTEWADATRGDRRGGTGLADPERVLREEGRPDRRLRIGSPRAAGGRAVYRDGAFLVRQGTREPLVEADPPLLYVLHRDPQAPEALLLEGVAPDGEARWRAPLGLAELANRWQLDDRLVLYGPAADPGPPGSMPDLIVVVRRGAGSHRRQRVQDAALAPPADPSSAPPATR